MLLIKFGHDRWDVAYDRDLSTDDRVQWTNVSDKPIKVELNVLGVCQRIPFTIDAHESYVGFTGTILQVAE